MASSFRVVLVARGWVALLSIDRWVARGDVVRRETAGLGEAAEGLPPWLVIDPLRFILFGLSTRLAGGGNLGCTLVEILVVPLAAFGVPC